MKRIKDYEDLLEEVPEVRIKIVKKSKKQTNDKISLLDRKRKRKKRNRETEKS